MRTLVLGVSTRAIVESAVHAGYEVVAVDFFGDRDQVACAETYALERDLGLPASAEGLRQASERVAADAVVYGSNLENHPEMVDQIAARRQLLGNPAEVLREVRDWAVLRRFCSEAGIACPETLLCGEERAARRGRWLRKRVHSGGGYGVRRRRRGRLDAEHVLQAEVDGRVASAAFVADGRSSRVFSLSEQLVGRPALGGRGFAWCGNILPLDLPAADTASVRAQVDDLAARLTRRFGLVGVNGVDLVVGRDPDGVMRPYLIEVNPRFSGSMELAERASSLSVFALHVEGCAGRLPSGPLVGEAPLRYVGKGIVYAKRRIRIPDTDDWLERGVKDVPWSGSRVAAGHPVCTVLAQGHDRAACRGGLHDAAAAVYRDREKSKEAACGRTTHHDQRMHV